MELLHGEEARRIALRAVEGFYAPSEIADLVGRPERVYYRVYRGPGGYAVFYLLYWRRQLIPYHDNDYEPVIVLTDGDGRPREVYVDAFHYYVKGYRVEGPPWILVNSPWHSMEAGEGPPPRYAEPIADPSKMVELTDSELTRLERMHPNPLRINRRIIENPWSVRRAAHFQTYRPPTLEELLRDIGEDYGETITARLDRVLHAIAARLAALIHRALRET